MSVHQVCVPSAQIVRAEIGTSVIRRPRPLARGAIKDEQPEPSANRLETPRQPPETMLVVCHSILAVTAGVMVAVNLGIALSAIVAAVFGGGLLTFGLIPLLQRRARARRQAGAAERLI